MTIEAHARSIRKVRSELDQQRTEVLVDEIKVVLVTHHAGTTQLRERFAGMRAELLGDPEGREFLLRLADVEHAFGGMKVR